MIGQSKLQGLTLHYQADQLDKNLALKTFVAIAEISWNENIVYFG